MKKIEATEIRGFSRIFKLPLANAGGGVMRWRCPSVCLSLSLFLCSFILSPVEFIKSFATWQHLAGAGAYRIVTDQLLLIFFYIKRWWNKRHLFGELLTMLGYQEIRATYVTRLPGCNHVNYLIGMLKSWYISSFFEIYHLRACWTLFIEKLCWFKAASVRTLFHRWSRQTGLRTFEDFKISKICINSAVSCNRVLLCFLSNLSVFFYLRQRRRYMFLSAHPSSFVCLSVC